MTFPPVPLAQVIFTLTQLLHVQETTISLLYELINLRVNYIVFSGDFNFNHSDILTLIKLRVICLGMRFAFIVRCIRLRVHLSVLLY